MLTSAVKFVGSTTLASIASGYVVHYLGVLFLADGDMRQVASTVAQIAATMMGFLIASLAILASIANMRLLRNMQRVGTYGVLLERMIISAVFFFFTLLFALAVMVAPQKVPYALVVGAGLLAGSCYALVRAICNFSMVLFALRPDSRSLE